MALSMLCRRTRALNRTLNGISPSNTLPPAHFLLQTASYNPRPLKLNLRDPYIPDKTSERTPEWQKTAKYDAKLFGRYGSASGIAPSSLWPSHDRLQKIIADEREWQPSLEAMRKKLDAREKEETEKRLAREKVIAANMAKMPKMVAEWRREKREAKKKQAEEKARRSRLLVEARERFGYTVDPRSTKFLEMVAEIEKEEKKKKKLMKRKLREEQAAAPATPPAAAAASSS